MTVKVELKFSKADGSVPITMFNWIDTLPEERQHEFNEAKVREEAAAAAATAGKLVHAEEDLQHWDSVESFTANQTNEAAHDPVWKKYWDEYVTVNAIIFEQVVSTIE